MSFWDIFRNMKNNPASSATRSSRNADADPYSEEGAQIEVFDSQGTRLELGTREYKTAGGEGSVYSLPANPRVLVKIYKSATLADRNKRTAIGSRILDMSAGRDLPKRPGLAWPLMPVFDATGDAVGFAMRKCEGHSLLALRGPANIRKVFPGWNRRDLVETALDFVRKVRMLADHGVLVNDFNPANFLVDRDHHVSFIDCDSYQVPASRGGVHVSHTYFPSYSAPELLRDNSLLARPRSIRQVEFGTAMIVFHIVMCGLHPYAYYDPGHKSDCGTPDENLVRGRCPLGVGAGCVMPPGIWYNLWSHLTCSLKSAFITTFRDGHGDLRRRTSLEQWEAELNKMLHVMDQDPARNELIPKKAKPRGTKSASSSSGSRSQSSWRNIA